MKRILFYVWVCNSVVELLPTYTGLRVSFPTPNNSNIFNIVEKERIWASYFYLFIYFRCWIKLAITLVYLLSNCLADIEQFI